LAPPHERGKAVGAVMTGLLMGILLSRVVSGFVAENFGWRAMFVAAAVSVALLAVVLAKGLPRFAPTSNQSYPALLTSLAHLWVAYPKLRQAALAQSLLALGFSAFWSTLAVMLHEAPFHLGSAAAGAFGLAGAAGALAAALPWCRSHRCSSCRCCRCRASWCCWRSPPSVSTWACRPA
jgi:predicted MFS family arabinose efflux permease